MKRNSLRFGIVSLLPLLCLFCGCDGKSTQAEALTAQELATLQGFRTWKIQLPEIPTDVRGVRLAVLAPSGKVTKSSGALLFDDKFRTDGDKGMLIGMDIEEGKVSGRIALHGAIMKYDFGQVFDSFDSVASINHSEWNERFLHLVANSKTRGVGKSPFEPGCTVIALQYTTESDFR